MHTQAWTPIDSVWCELPYLFQSFRQQFLNTESLYFQRSRWCLFALLLCLFLLLLFGWVWFLLLYSHRPKFATAHAGSQKTEAFRSYIFFLRPFNVNYEVGVSVLAGRTLVFVWSTLLWNFARALNDTAQRTTTATQVLEAERAAVLNCWDRRSYILLLYLKCGSRFGQLNHHY